MNKILKVMIIVVTIIVCIKMLLTIENLIQIILDNSILISFIVVVFSGLYVLITGKDTDSEFRPIAKLIFVISILTLGGQLIGFYSEKGIDYFFK